MTSSNSPESDDSRHAHARDALVKARSLVDEIEAADKRKRETQRYAIILGVVAVVGILVYVTWQKQRNTVSAERDACENAEIQKRVAEVKTSLMRDQPSLNPRDLRAEIDKRVAQDRENIVKACAAK